jgi:hypothetical protein
MEKEESTGKEKREQKPKTGIRVFFSYKRRIQNRGERGYMKRGATSNINIFFLKQVLNLALIKIKVIVFHFAPDDFAFHTAPLSPRHKVYLFITNIEKRKFKTGNSCVVIEIFVFVC